MTSLSDEYDPKFASMIANLRSQGLETIATELISLLQQPSTPSLYAHSVSKTIPQTQLEASLQDFSHLSRFENNTQSLPESALFNFSSESCLPFATYLAAISPDGRLLALFEGDSIVVTFVDEFFHHQAIPPTPKSSSTPITNNAVPHPKFNYIWRLPNQNFTIRQMKWSPIENNLFVLCSNNTILIYSFGHPIPLHIRDLDDISVFDIHPTGKFLLFASRETPLIKLYDLTTFTTSVSFSANSICSTQNTLPESTIQYLQNEMTPKNGIIELHEDNDEEEHEGTETRLSHLSKQPNTHSQQIHQLHILEATDLPQFPVYHIQYSNFAQYFAVLTVSPQIGTNVPVIQIRIYNTVDHTLLNTFDLPLHYHIPELSSALQHLNFTAISRPHLPAVPPRFDHTSTPITLHWSPNDRFLLVTTPFQPFCAKLSPAAHLFDIHDGQLLLSYTPPCQEPQPSSNININSFNPLFDVDHSKPLVPSSFYNGYKAFFSLDSQHVFLVNSNPIPNSDPYTRETHIGEAVMVFRTATGAKLNCIESYLAPGADESVQGRQMGNSPANSKIIGLPSAVFPDPSRPCFYFFSSTHHAAFKIDYSFQK